jgi:hypothetical protein
MPDFASTVTTWYQAVQFRDPPSSDFQKYVVALQSGTMTSEQVQTAIENDPFTVNVVSPIVREYQAAFGRVPDQAGLKYWVGVVASNPNALLTLGSTFASSAEFKASFGTTSPDQPVDYSLAFKLYTNVLGRVPDQSGLDYWVKSGASASQLLNSFAQSTEYTSSTNDKIKIFFDLELAGTPATSGSLLQVQPAPPVTTPPPPSFTAIKDGSNAVTFANAGPAISMQLSGGTYTFTSSGVPSSVTGTVASISVPSTVTLTLAAADAGSITFPNAGTVALSDTALTAAALVTLETHATGLLDASHVTSMTSASVADAYTLLVTDNGSSGDHIKTAANVAVTLTGTTATGTQLAGIDSATTGLVDATTITSLAGATVAQAKLVLVTDSPAGVTHNAAVTVALTDTSASAADLNGIDAATTGLITASSLTGISGALSDVKTALETITTGTAIAATALNSVTLTDAITTSALDNVVFANNATITLANVSGNSLTLVDATTGSGKTLTIDGSAATSAITINGVAETNGTLIIKGGAGADTITGGTGADTLTGGGGIDNFVYTAGTRSTLASTDSITDYRASGGANAGALDTITINDITTVASNINTVQDLSAQASLAAALNVFANAATTNNGLGVFKWGGDEYVFIETTGSTTTYQAGDTVIKLVGAPFTAGTSIVGLGVDGV